MANDIVRIRNTGKDAFKDQYGAVPYAIPAGEAVIIPFDAACLWLGDPRVINKPTLSQYDRDDELHRVKTRLGAVVKEAMSEPWEPPALEVEDLEGNRIYMVVEDPDGLKGSIPTKTFGLSDTEAVAAELEAVKRQQAALLARLDELSRGADAPTLDDVPDDVPSKVPVSE